MRSLRGCGKITHPKTWHSHTRQGKKSSKPLAVGSRPMRRATRLVMGITVCDVLWVAFIVDDDIYLDHDTHVIGDENAGQSRARALFGKNYGRLQVLKKKYDPSMIFNKWFVITPSP